VCGIEEGEFGGTRASRSGNRRATRRVLDEWCSEQNCASICTKKKISTDELFETLLSKEFHQLNLSSTKVIDIMAQ
jgi:hypothetical protein